MSIMKIKFACALALTTIFGAPATFAADLIAASPRVASHRVAAQPVCQRGCKQLRVCDDLIVSHGDRSKVVAVCYKAKY